MIVLGPQRNEVLSSLISKIDQLPFFQVDSSSDGIIQAISETGQASRRASGGQDERVLPLLYHLSKEAMQP